MKRGRKKKRGRKRGTKVPATPAMIAACRANPWKSGKYARSVSSEEVALTRVRQRHPEAAAVYEAVYEAHINGNLEGMDLLVSNALTESELMRRMAVDEVQRRGVLVKEDLVDSDGKVIGSRLRANPASEVVIELNKQLGATAADQLLTRKARGEGAVDIALARRLARDEMLRRSDKSRMPPPPPIETSGKVVGRGLETQDTPENPNDLLTLSERLPRDEEG